MLIKVPIPRVEFRRSRRRICHVGLNFDTCPQSGGYNGELMSYTLGALESNRH
jgi:hypothetical protein